MAVCKLLMIRSVFNKSPWHICREVVKGIHIRILCWWGPACVDHHGFWCLIKLSADWQPTWKGNTGAKTLVCLNAPSQPTQKCELSIRKKAQSALMTAVWGKEGVNHVEMSLSLHPSWPLLQCLIPLFHLGRVETAQLLHSYNWTPSETCPQWLLPPHRLWLKLFCLETAGVYMMTAHSRQAYNGMRTVDCKRPSV